MTSWHAVLFASISVSLCACSAETSSPGTSARDASALDAPPEVASVDAPPEAASVSCDAMMPTCYLGDAGAWSCPASQFPAGNPVVCPANAGAGACDAGGPSCLVCSDGQGITCGCVGGSTEGSGSWLCSSAGLPCAYGADPCPQG